jgi:hypothetical protein
MTICRCEHDHEHGCTSVPTFERPTFHFGQMLGQAEFIAQHEYLARKLDLVTRYGIGHGVACGLTVSVIPRTPERCDTPRFHQETWWVVIEHGIAIDCEGRLIVVRRRVECRLVDLISPADLKALEGGDRFWVSVCFDERPVCPSRPLVMDACDPCAPSPFARYRDDVRFAVTFTAPADACDSCCGPCGDGCVPLALVETVEDGSEKPTPEVTDIRRPLGPRLTTVDAVSWIHGGTYTSEDIKQMLKEGVGVRFSSPVYAGSIAALGVVDVAVLQGGGVPAGTAYHPSFVVEPRDVSDGWTAEIALRFVQPDRIDNRGRFLVAIRGDHVLDRCCRALDGNHIGGGVRRYTPEWASTTQPVEPPAWTPVDCVAIGRRVGHLGNGTEGGTFESWFYAQEAP